MAFESSDNTTSPFSKQWSFRSTSSSSTSKNSITDHHNLFSTQEIISYFSLHQPYYTSIATLKTQNHHHITCMTVHNNILYAASGNQISTFDLITLSPIPSFNGQDLSSGGFIKSMEFYNDDKLLTAHQDSKIRVWKRHRFVTTLPTMKDKLCRSIFGNNYVQVRRHKRKLWIEHNDAVSGLRVNNGVIYTVSWDKTLKIWRGSDFKCLESITAHADAVNAVEVSRNGTVYTGSADGTIKVWERRNDTVWKHSMVSILEKHRSTVNTLALSEDGRVLLSGGCGGVIIAWERDDNDRMVEIGEVVGGHDGAVLCMIGLDGHDFFVSGGADRTVRIWGRAGGNGGSGCRGLFCCMGVLVGHDKPVRSVTVTAECGVLNDVVLVCSGSLDGEIKVWRIVVSELIKYNQHTFNYLAH